MYTVHSLFLLPNQKFMHEIEWSVYWVQYLNVEVVQATKIWRKWPWIIAKILAVIWNKCLFLISICLLNLHSLKNIWFVGINGNELLLYASLENSRLIVENREQPLSMCVNWCLCLLILWFLKIGIGAQTGIIMKLLLSSWYLDTYYHSMAIARGIADRL